MVAIKITSIVPSELTITNDGQKGLQKARWALDIITNCNQYAKGWFIKITNRAELTLAETGEKCSLECVTVYELETDFDLEKNKTSQIAIGLLSEMTATANGHLRAFFMEKAKGTNFKDRFIKFQFMGELAKGILPNLTFGQN